MILISAPWPDASNERNGMVRRVAAIDKALDGFERVYLNFRFGPPGSWAPASLESVAPRVRRVELNPFEHADQETLVSLADQSACLLAHSVYWARHILPFYRSRPVITDMHGIVPEEVLMMRGSPAEAERQSRVEAFVLSHGALALTVTDAMATHLRAKHDVRARLLTLPVEGGAPPRDVLAKPRELRVVYSGGTEVWQQVELMARSIAAWPEQAVVLRSHDVVEMRRVLASVGADVEVVSESPAEILETYARCHFGFVLREDHIVNAVASPTKLQEYLSHGVVPIVMTPRIGDFDSLGYRYITLEEYQRKALPSFELWQEMAAHNLEISRVQAAASEAGKSALREVVDEAHRRAHASLQTTMLPEILLASDTQSIFNTISWQATQRREEQTERERAERVEREREHARVVNALTHDVEDLKRAERSAHQAMTEALVDAAATKQHAEWMTRTRSWRWTSPFRRMHAAARRARRSAAES